MSEGNRFDQMRAAVRDVEMTMSAADTVACQLAPLLAGRLRNCHARDVARLKRELRDFNIHTGTWRDR